MDPVTPVQRHRAPYALPKNKVFADEFHVYSTVWTEAQINFYVDAHLYKTVTPKDLPGQWIYDHPFFMILNLAVGETGAARPMMRPCFLRR